MRADEMTSYEFQNITGEDRVFIVPVGSMEGHGPHLPLGTDLLQPMGILEEIAARTGAVVMPPLPYGVCVGTRTVPGTFSLSFDTVRGFARDMVLEMARNGIKRVLFLSGHAGRSHMAALKEGAREALEQLGTKMVVYVLSDYDFAYEREDLPEDDGHGGCLETSRVMALRPDLVRPPRPVSHPTIQRFRIYTGEDNILPDGMHGDSSRATVEYGEKVNRDIIENIVAVIEEMKKLPL